MQVYDVVIVGAGAAGMMCAMQAGRRGRRVLLLDHASAVGEKIRISGGGRCNFTNLHVKPEAFISNNPYFCISALKSFTQHDFINLVTKHNISYHEKTLGQLFCDGSSRLIINMLTEECTAANVQIMLNTNVTAIAKNDAGFTINCNGLEINCSAIVIATGGPSIPKMGATGWGYEIAKQFDMKIIQPRAALVPFTLDKDMLARFSELAGVAVNAIVTCNKKSFKEALLFTHRGLSGPAILQISSYWQAGDVVTINLAAEHDLNLVLKEKKNAQPKQELQTTLAQILPKRLAQLICNEIGFNGKMADLSNKLINQIADRINRWQIIPSGTEGFRTAEVTIGGVDTDGLSARSFESKAVKGLYFIGEVIDVTGHLGGYNFQWAWSSGYAAGQFV